MFTFPVNCLRLLKVQYFKKLKMHSTNKLLLPKKIKSICCILFKFKKQHRTLKDKSTVSIAKVL